MSWTPRPLDAHLEKINGIVAGVKKKAEMVPLHYVSERLEVVKRAPGLREGMAALGVEMEDD